jgi:transposase
MDEDTTPSTPAQPEDSPPPTRPTPPRRRPGPLEPETVERLLALRREERSTREIAQRLQLGRKVVRRILKEAGLTEAPAHRSQPPRPTTASKLDPFRLAIEERVAKDLTTERILRELRELGYTGGRSILGRLVRQLRAATRPAKQRAWRRFETPPGEEIQVDWSPYTVELGGRVVRVVAFAALLCWSRKLHVRFYLDERTATLLQALDAAYADFGGAARRVVVDNMRTAVLVRHGSDGRPIWNPRFLAFVEAWGVTPRACKVRDPNRKGKDERTFWYLETSFVRGSVWASLDELNERVRAWLDQVANVRVHGTTRRVPDEAWREERPLLLAPPALRPIAYDEEPRQVGDDAVISVRGTAYTVPAALAGLTVVVRLHADRFEVLDPRTSAVALGRAYVPDAEKGRLVIDPAHLAPFPARRSPKRPRAEDELLRRFPSLGPLVDGLRRRFSALAHVHLGRLARLAERYGDAAFLAAATRVQELGRHDATDVEHLLERQHPLPPEHEPIPPAGAAARALAALGDVDPGSLDDYAELDRADGVAAQPGPEADEAASAEVTADYDEGSAGEVGHGA